jgi:hypothetical protein
MDRCPHQRGADDLARRHQRGQLGRIEVLEPRLQRDVRRQRRLGLEPHKPLDQLRRRPAPPVQQLLALEQRTVQGTATEYSAAGHRGAHRPGVRKNPRTSRISNSPLSITARLGVSAWVQNVRTIAVPCVPRRTWASASAALSSGYRADLQGHGARGKEAQEGRQPGAVGADVDLRRGDAARPPRPRSGPRCPRPRPPRRPPRPGPSAAASRGPTHHCGRCRPSSPRRRRAPRPGPRPSPASAVRQVHEARCRRRSGRCRPPAWCLSLGFPLSVCAVDVIHLAESWTVAHRRRDPPDPDHSLTPLLSITAAMNVRNSCSGSSLRMTTTVSSCCSTPRSAHASSASARL